MNLKCAIVRNVQAEITGQLVRGEVMVQIFPESLPLPPHPTDLRIILQATNSDQNSKFST